MAATASTVVALQTNSEIEKLFEACRHDNSELVESLLSGKKTEEDKTALVNSKHTDLKLTPLHEACYHGNQKCIRVLLKHKADGRTYDKSGVSPIHVAAHSGQHDALKLLLINKACDVNITSQNGETALHLACLRGHLILARYLVQEGADLMAEDEQESNVLHFACSNDNAELVLWLLEDSGVKEVMDKANQRGHTPCHQACILGCPNSLSALIHHDVNLSPHTSHPLTPSQCAQRLGNQCCYDIAEGNQEPLKLPTSIPTSASFYREDSQASDPLRQSQASATFFIAPPLRSNSIGSKASLLSTASVQRRGSLLGTSRPVNLSIRRSSSLRRGTAEDGQRGREGDSRIYLPSRDSANKLSQSLDKQSSRSLDQLLYDSTAYEPPPDIIFILPIEREVLTSNKRRFYSTSHDIKLRVSQDYWTSSNKSETLSVCLCAAMHYSQSFPEGFTVVSPICFLSCRSAGPCEVNLTLPHAVSLPKGEDSSRLVVLTTATAKVDPSGDPDSPFFSPSERILAPLEGANVELEENHLKFRTDLSYPSLFAVAVREGPGSIPLPLCCTLYVLYPELDQHATLTGFDVETYIGMSLRTVATAMTSWSTNHNLKLEEKHFTMRGEEVRVTGALTSHPLDWEIERRGEGKFHYSQVALTQHTDRGTYSHQLAYPPRDSFFIEPKEARGAVKCKVGVANTISELCTILVVPYTPRRDPTPDPGLHPPPGGEHRYSLPLPQRPTVSPPPPHLTPSPPPSRAYLPHQRSPILLRLPQASSSLSESQV